ncbi:MAG TPA: hypothetical protein VFY92_03955, partial [Hyphomicrobiaceae bacterium]|nr:hypothetical protein [Hyphomicrobiaceae bacterium]
RRDHRPHDDTDQGGGVSGAAGRTTSIGEEPCNSGSFFCVMVDILRLTHMLNLRKLREVGPRVLRWPRRMRMRVRRGEKMPSALQAALRKSALSGDSETDTGVAATGVSESW